jgi:hypothetical protein
MKDSINHLFNHRTNISHDVIFKNKFFQFYRNKLSIINNELKFKLYNSYFKDSCIHGVSGLDFKKIKQYYIYIVVGGWVYAGEFGLVIVSKRTFDNRSFVNINIDECFIDHRDQLLDLLDRIKLNIEENILNSI